MSDHRLCHPAESDSEITRPGRVTVQFLNLNVPLNFLFGKKNTGAFCWTFGFVGQTLLSLATAAMETVTKRGVKMTDFLINIMAEFISPTQLKQLAQKINQSHQTQLINPL